MFYETTYYSFTKLKETIENYIKYYNQQRRKEKLGLMNPVEYRLNSWWHKNSIVVIKTTTLLKI